jgi:MFS family permease
MQYPGGAFSDAVGRKKIIALSLVFFSFASFLMGMNINFVTFVFTCSFIGFASGILPIPSFTMIAELFGPQKGKALGIHSSIGSISGLVPLILPFIVVIFGWRNIFLLWGVFGFIIAYLFYLLSTESLTKPEKKSHIDRFKTGLKSLTEKDAFFMLIVNLIISFAWIGLLSWFPTYIQQEKGFGPEVAGLLFSIVLSGGLLLKPIIGHLSDKINRLLIMTVLTALACISLYVLTISNSFIVLVIVSFMLSQTSAFYLVRTSYLMDIWHSKSAGTNLGVFRSLIILLGSPISALIGWSKGIYEFNTIILMISIGLLFAVVLLVIRLVKEEWAILKK